MTSGSYVSQSCIYLLSRHLFVGLNCVLGWGVPLLCKAFGGFALTFSGNTYLIKTCVLDFQSLINRLCVTFHIAIFSPYCCLYCLYEQSSAHISFSLRFAVIMDKLKHKYIFPFCRNGSDEAIVQCKGNTDVHFVNEFVQ